MAAAAGTLIVGPNWVGDMVMAHGLVQALAARFPGEPIAMLAPPVTAAVARRMAELGEVIEIGFSPHAPAFAARWTLARQLRHRYARAYILPGSWISALVPALAGIPERTGYRGEHRYGLLTRIMPMPPTSRRHIAQNYARLADALPVVPRLVVDRARQAELLATFGLRRKAFVALVPGAANGEAKRWPAAHYAELARQLLSDGEAVALLGGPADAAVAAEIAAAAPGVRNLAGRTSVADAVDVVAAARQVVANDSGLMHVAAAVGTPVVALFGPTAPAETAPAGGPVTALWRGLSCSPCHARLCPLGHHACLVGLAPALVLASLAEPVT